MAFVKVTWAYGDTASIDGFRVYRDNVLRFETTDTTIREYNDSVDDFIGLRATYAVVAFDQFARESTQCAVADVELTYILTPAMTGQLTPSGEALASASGACSTGEGWRYFNQSAEDNNWSNNADYYGTWKVEITYQFSSDVILNRWGWTEAYSQTGGIWADMTPDPFRLYSEEISTGIRTLIGTQDNLVNYAYGTQRVFDVTSVSASKFVFVAGGTNTNTYAFISKIGEVLLFGQPT